MVRHSAANLCLLAWVIADALLIGAAGMRPRAPPRSAAVFVPPPPVAPASPASPPSARPAAPTDAEQIGVASWYGAHWQGRVMASGKRFDARKLTAAHRTLPLNTRVRVTDLQSGRSVDVTITDRGPYARGRVIDLSAAAAKKLGMVKQGLAPVQIATVVPDAAGATEPPTKVASLDMR
ncbi:MAG TPA: septal ring lytic transglycosylase RlpA family protein [Stellaceae bacterium]|nr:septal ring lytic transglycosylase RlpA family protein [Stellaceae bacterium]